MELRLDHLLPKHTNMEYDQLIVGTLPSYLLGTTLNYIDSKRHKDCYNIIETNESYAIERVAFDQAEVAQLVEGAPTGAKVDASEVEAIRVTVPSAVQDPAVNFSLGPYPIHCPRDPAS